MDRIARADAAERGLVFEAAAVRLGTTPAVVEKDFWVCYALEHMFHRCPLSEALTFKGGTSLSKAFHLIQRFSEDVDLILDWRALGYGRDEALLTALLRPVPARKLPRPRAGARGHRAPRPRGGVQGEVLPHALGAPERGMPGIPQAGSAGVPGRRAGGGLPFDGPHALRGVPDVRGDRSVHGRPRGKNQRTKLSAQQGGRPGWSPIVVSEPHLRLNGVASMRLSSIYD